VRTSASNSGGRGSVSRGASIDIRSARVDWSTGVDWSDTRLAWSDAGVNRDRGGGDNSGADGLGDRAWAVGDSQGGGLSDGVGDTTVGDLSGFRAVGGVGSYNLSRVDWASVVAPGIGASDESGGSGDSSGETHVDGINYLRW